MMNVPAYLYGFCVGVVTVVGGSYFYGREPITGYEPRSIVDIGIKFDDSAKAITLRDYKMLPTAEIKQKLDEAFENYRLGKTSVITLKLPAPALAK